MKHGSEMAVERAEQPEIDFVILWVDGNDPEHRRKRQRYLCEFQSESEHNAEQSTDDKRFVQHDELKYCLRSIKQYAPWYRRIHLVTDNQVPAFLDQSRLHQDRIELVDHKILFSGFEDYLPTFNTRCLTTMMWRIPDLTECFIYGNDDLILGRHISTNFFFDRGRPVIRGDWKNLSVLDSLTLHQKGILNAAKLMGYSEENLMISSHGFQPFKKSHIKLLYEKYPSDFINNIDHKFRHESQFLLESLYNHYCVYTGAGLIEDTQQMVHFSFELCRIGPIEKICFLFELIKTGSRTMFCLNEYDSLLCLFPEVEKMLDEICGPPLQSEIIVKGYDSYD